ncbi:hypothetical protein [Polyangium jinanense]|uniref:Uncharacterized protein n=1 Tax=Polyangium jinanense TaxID=2829994 RepID=A0A9X4AQF9_9BACT|nr:hypothetical protein [Polyangium jinanense]MDC3954761.1 hypothetical protein [Polyangium jinanense]MDC3961891.1 hypothetical protein [Polyangium jinanense]MDC3981064.1 hypothetical protein [Polyangium jinanense]
MVHRILLQLRLTLYTRAPEAFAFELSERFRQLRIAGMVDGRVLPDGEVSALLHGLTSLAGEAIPSLTRRNPSVALNVVEVARLASLRAGVEQALVARAPHLGPLLEVFGARPAARQYRLSTWLTDFAAVTGRLRKVSPDDFVDAVGEGLDPWAEYDKIEGRWQFHESGSAEVRWLLSAIGCEDDLATHKGKRWVHTFDHRDGDAWEELPKMIGVPEDEDFDAELQAWRESEETMDVFDFVDLCNARAHALGCELRLFSVETHGDDHLFVALPPLACKSAVERGLLEVTPYVPHLSTRPRWSLWHAGVVLLAGVLALALAYALYPAARTSIEAVCLLGPLMLAIIWGNRWIERTLAARFPAVVRALKSLRER